MVKSAVPHIVPAVDTLIADESVISELMNKAWSSHEITDYHIEKVNYLNVLLNDPYRLLSCCRSLNGSGNMLHSVLVVQNLLASTRKQCKNQQM